MDIKQMRYFVAIARNGSLAQAAADIGIAQPSLSQQVKRLEEGIGVDLLVRSSKGVTLTEAGETLLRHAEKIIAAMEEAKEEVRQSGTDPSGHVSFGFPSSVSMVLSVPLAETIRHEYPKIGFRAVEAMSGFIKDWLRDESIDLAVLYDVENLRNIESHLLMTEDLYFFAAPDAWSLDSKPGEPASLGEVARQDLVLPSNNHGLRILIDRFCKSSGINLNVVVEMDSLAQIKTLVARGSASTILAPASAHDFEQQGELVSARIVDPVIRRPVYLVRNPDKQATRATRVVEELTVSVVQELVRRDVWKGNLTASDAAI